VLSILCDRVGLRQVGARPMRRLVDELDEEREIEVDYQQFKVDVRFDEAGFVLSVVASMAGSWSTRSGWS
jgi:hypothetical protein